MKKIFLLGAFSGINAGDEAILESTLINLKQEFRDVKFLIPSREPKNIEKYNGEYNILTTNLSISYNFPKVLWNYINLIRLMIMADSIIITASLFYEYKLFRFSQNTFLGMLFFIIFSKILNKKIGLYSAGIGPIYTPFGRKAIGFMIRNLDFLILRDNHSRILAESLGVKKDKIHVTADVALLTPHISHKKLKILVNKERIGKKVIGVNINFYIDSFLSGKSKMRKKEFIKIVGGSLDDLSKKFNLQIIFFVFCPWDKEINESIVKNMDTKGSVRIISFPKYNHREIISLIDKMDFFIGMRLHSLIFAFSNNVPFISINYAQKCHDFLELAEENNKEIVFKELSQKNLTNKIINLWGKKKKISMRYKSKSRKLKQIASSNSKILSKILI